MTVNQYEFVFWLTTPTLSSEQCDLLYECGCDDGTIVARDGITYIALGGEAQSVGPMHACFIDAGAASVRDARGQDGHEWAETQTFPPILRIPTPFDRSLAMQASIGPRIARIRANVNGS